MATVKDVDGVQGKMQPEFCKHCGAGIGQFRRAGEGTCQFCDPDIKGQRCHSLSECLCCYGSTWAHSLTKDHCKHCEKPQIRQFPEEVERVETGPIRFGEDWPGLFIRGDNAYAYRIALEGLYRRLREEKSTTLAHHLELANVKALIEALNSCNINDHAMLEKDWHLKK